MNRIKFNNRTRLMLLLPYFTILQPGFNSFHNPDSKTSFELKAVTKSDTFPSFLLISDIHLNADKETQAEASCSCGNSGKQLWDSAKHKIDSLCSKSAPRFVIVLGDLPFHANCSQPKSIDSARRSIDTVLHGLVELAKQNKIPFIIVPGNNDSWFGDYRKFSLPDDFYKNYKYPLMDFSERDPSEKAAFADSINIKDGYYSVYPLGQKTRLKIIVLNTTMFVRDNRCEYGGDQRADADSQMVWFENQLKHAETLNDHVIIAMHVSPGIDGYKTFVDPHNSKHDTIYNWNLPGVQDTFLSLVSAHKNCIVGVLASHTHMDGIMLLQAKSGLVSTLLISAPGIAPGHGNNPALKIVHYDSTNFGVQNFTTYYMNYWNECQNKTRSNCHEKITTWTDSLTFPEKNQNFSLLQYLQNEITEQKKSNIQTSVNKIYSVNGKLQDSNQVNASIYVRFRK